MVTRIVKTPQGRKTTRPTGETDDSLRVLARQVGAAATDAALHFARLMQDNVSKTAGGVMGLHGERMSRVDRAWLRMDSPSNLMMIVGFWILKPRVNYEVVCQRIRERMLKYPRFHQKVVEDATGANWVEDAGFDIYKHVVRERLPRVARGAEKAALQDLVGRLAVEPLDPSRPLWKMHLVENYRDEDGKPASVLIVRIHHCIADGIALIAVTMSLVDGGAEPPVRAPSQATESAEDWVAHNLVEPLAHMAVKALDAAGDGAAASLHLLREPGKGVSGSADLAKIAYHVLGDAAALALMTDDSKTRLKGKAGTAKRVAWCQPIPLDEVKAVGKALNCSVNDVLLSCVAGAIGEYLKAKGDSVKGKEIRAMIPVNLRPIQDAWKLGNHFGLAPLVLPIGIDNPIERVYEVRRRMQGLKGGHPAADGLWPAGRGRDAGQAGTGRDAQPVQQEDHGGDDQCAGPAREAQVLRRHAGAKPGLGAAVGRRRPGRVHPELRRRRAVRRDLGQPALPGPAGHHRRIRTGICQAVDGDADVAMGGVSQSFVKADPGFRPVPGLHRGGPPCPGES